MNKETENQKAWCRTHLPQMVGKDQFDNFYTRCYIGHSRNEDCEIVIEKEVEKNE